eukprot:1667073-Rhodomonas_salina.1
MEVVNEEKSRRKVFTRLESKQQVDNIAMTRRYLMEWNEAVREHRSRRLFLQRLFLKDMMTTTRRVMIEWMEV